MKTTLIRAGIILIVAHTYYLPNWWYRDHLETDRPYPWSHRSDLEAYYHTARGDFDSTAQYSRNMAYKPWVVRVAYWPLAQLPIDVAFKAMYYLGVLAWMMVVARLPDNNPGWLIYALSHYIYLPIIGTANVQPILFWAALSPWGSLAAGLLKPYFLLFALIHAGRAAIGLRPVLRDVR